VLKACKDSKINFVRLKLSELNDLVGLLGTQENYADLEWLLKTLWSSREVQKNWSADTIVAIGSRLVQAHFLVHGSKNAFKAINLCEAISYNLRRVYGPLDPKSLAMSELLSQVYTDSKHYQDAMRVHEDILRLVVEGDDDDDKTTDTVDARTARKHVNLLKQAYLHNQGWDKNPKVYKDLIDQLLSMPEYQHQSAEFKSVERVDNWNLKEKPDSSGCFVPPLNWEFVDPDSLLGGVGKGTEYGRPCGFASTVPKRHNLGMRRITGNWGMNIHLLGGEHTEMAKPTTPTYYERPAASSNGVYSKAQIDEQDTVQSSAPSFESAPVKTEVEPDVLVKQNGNVQPDVLVKSPATSIKQNGKIDQEKVKGDK
jgi:hypothetical protein